ncbi:MAG: PIG-L family deacetylase [Desulfomonile tiedjei]|nr:PIG-L family deacetylase [Desulfomonile tiedjei]
MLDSLKAIWRKLLFDRASPEMILLLKHIRCVGSSFYFPLSHKLVRQPGITRGRVLVLAPHADDEIIGLGGTMAMHLEAGTRILVLYMTAGDKGDSTLVAQDLAKVRKREAEEIAKNFGFESVFWQYEDQRLGDHVTEAGLKLSAILDAWRPDSVFVPSCIDSHKDHFSANLVLAEALQKGSYDHIPIYGYEVATDIPFPNHVVDITTHFEKKMEMLSYYKSQSGFINYSRLCMLRNGLNYARYVDGQAEGYAEAYLRWPASSYRQVVKDLARECRI